MSRGRTSTPGRRPAPRRPRPALLVVLVLLAGCAGPRATPGVPDPLTGGPPLGAPAPLPGATAGGTGANGVPPLPPSGAPVSPAGLTSTLPAAGDTSRNLRLDPAPGGSSTAGQSSGTGTAGWQQGGPPSPAGVGLHPPVPASTPISAAPPVGTPGLTLTGGSGASDYEQMQAQLKARNAQYQRLEMVGNGDLWRFSCRVPADPKQPNILNLYESPPTPGGNGIPAMRIVLDRINQDMH